MNKELKLSHKIYRVQGIHRHWYLLHHLRGLWTQQNIMQQAEDKHDRVRSKSKLPNRGLHIKSPPTDRRSPTVGSTEQGRPHRRPPGAPPRSIAQCSGQGSNPLQRPIRQNSKSTKENRGEIISLQDN